MAERDLFEALARPDNRVDFHVDKVVTFEQKYRSQLVAAEAAINPYAAPVEDAPDDPILVSASSVERSDILDMVHTSDVGFNKCVCVCVSLCEEAAFLARAANARFYAELALFGHTRDNDEDDAGGVSEGVLESMLARALPLLADVSNFTARVNEVVLAIIQQMAYLYAKDSPFRAAWMDVRMRPLTLALGDLLLVLLTLDSIVASNKKLTSAWSKYKRVAEVMQSAPEKYGAEPGKARVFEALVGELDKGIMRGACFRRCLEQPYAPLPPDPTHFFVDNLRDRILENIEFLLDSVNKETEIAESTQLVGQFALYALYRAITIRELPDKRIFERLWRLVERVPMVTLYHRCVWYPDAFLVEYAAIPGLALNKLTPKDPRVVLNAAADEITESIGGFAGTMLVRTSAWLTRASMWFAPRPLVAGKALPVAEVVKQRTILIHQAIGLTTSGRKTMALFLNYHMALSRGLKKRCIEPLARVIECVKALAAAMKCYAPAAAETIVHTQRENVAEILEKYLALRLTTTTSRKADAAVLRTITASTELVEHLCLSTESWTPLRCSVLQTALMIGMQKAGLSKDSDIVAVARAAWQLQTLADYQGIIQRASDMSCLYWVRDLFPALLSCAATIQGSGPGDADSRQGLRLQHLLAAFSDAAPFLARAVHLPPPPPTATRLAIASGSSQARLSVEAEPESPFFGLDHLLTAYECFLHQTLRTDIINPLARGVEADLRLLVHAVHLSHMKPFNFREPTHVPFVHLLQLPPLRITDAFVSIRQEVTLYLERTFYELSTVALHDWKTYGEMAVVAADKFGLQLLDNHLPMGGLDSGLDVLMIMRGIHQFVARFNYNMHQQFFVEKQSFKGSKHLNSVSIHSVSASLRQHGTGMMNTTVNFVYQFLAQKFMMFSQFLRDEYIKTFLAKERTFFREHRKTHDHRYPFGHAEELNKDIKKLGLTEDKQSYLDKFRQLVTEIGNALGYVRLVRSAGMHAASEAVQFIPDLVQASVFSFEEAAKAVGAVASDAPAEDGAAAAAPAERTTLSAETLEAARQLDAVTKNLTYSFTENVDYLKLLLAVFQHSLLNADDKPAAPEAAAAPAADGTAAAPAAAEPAKKKKKNEHNHLKTFFLIVPATMINFVRNSNAARDRMNSKDMKGTDMFFTDDGFAVGVAYILAILKQDRLFDSLHWREEVAAYHRGEMKRTEDELARLGKSKTDMERRDELEFSRRRIGIQEQDFNHLFACFRAARTFFRQEDLEEDEVAVQV